MINFLRKIFHMDEDKPSLKPYFEKQRPPCPFYGFGYVFNGILDTKGNQCALIKESHTPCQMEVQQQEPNWYKCSMNNLDTLSKEELKSLKEKYKNVRVFPLEFQPPDAKPWKGISLADWMKYILKTDSILETIE